MDAAGFSAAAGGVVWAKAAGDKAARAKVVASDSTAISSLILMSDSLAFDPSQRGGEELELWRKWCSPRMATGLEHGKARWTSGRGTGSRDHPLPRWVKGLNRSRGRAPQPSARSGER